jgi:protein TonB
MAQIYQSPSARKNSLLSLLLGVVFSFFVFLLVPVTQFIADVTKPDESYEVQQVSLPPPEEFEFEEEKVEEEEVKEEEIELEKEPPKLTLDQLDLALNASVGDLSAGDFGLPGFAASKNDLNLDDIFDMADLDQKPRPVRRVGPEYPRDLGRKKIEGTVKLLFIIDQDGNVTDVTVVEASHDDFAEAAVKAIKQWKFEPGMKYGQAVKTRTRLLVPFNLK